MPTRCLVLVPVRRQRGAAGGSGLAAKTTQPERSLDNRLEEAVGLARAIALDVRAAQVVPLAAPRPSTLFGSGKVEDIKALIGAHEAGLAVIDHALSPVQQRNLEKAWDCKVLDRTGLILEIFGERAQTREGRLQVELAAPQLPEEPAGAHLDPSRAPARRLRLPRRPGRGADRDRPAADRGAHREHPPRPRRRRQDPRAAPRRPQARAVSRGGDRRLHQRRQVDALQPAHRRRRARPRPGVRDARSRPCARSSSPSGRRIILSDTVGFISDLPTTLVAAFRATLEEVIAADLILHVRDIAHPESEAQRHDVEAVLARPRHRRVGC